jgi:hypothetical protein
MDSNAYIQAKNQYYDLEFCPAFWEWLEQQFQLGVVQSIDNVYVELTDSSDELSLWARAHKHHFISVADKQTQDTFSTIANYIASLSDKPQEEIAHFLSKADPWIIAKAATLGAIVVTHERRVAENSRKIKIPNICEIFSVNYMNTFSVLKTLEAKFVLGQ